MLMCAGSELQSGYWDSSTVIRFGASLLCCDRRRRLCANGLAVQWKCQTKRCWSITKRFTVVIACALEYSSFSYIMFVWYKRARQKGSCPFRYFDRVLCWCYTILLLTVSHFSSRRARARSYFFNRDHRLKRTRWNIKPIRIEHFVHVCTLQRFFLLPRRTPNCVLICYNQFALNCNPVAELFWLWRDWVCVRLGGTHRRLVNWDEVTIEWRSNRLPIDRN